MKRANVFTCAALALVAFAGCSGTVSIPSTYSTYNASDKSFKVEYPEGWSQQGGGNDRFHAANFKSGPAAIRVASDLAGSLMGDIAQSGNNMMLGSDVTQVDQETLDALAPVQQLHEMATEQLAEDYKDYEEVSTEKVQAGLGEGRKSEFTAKGGFGGAVHGVRATFLSRDRRITVLCKGPEKNWKALQPLFDHVIESVALGQ